MYVVASNEELSRLMIHHLDSTCGISGKMGRPAVKLELDSQCLVNGKIEDALKIWFILIQLNNLSVSVN
jgi:hypothetical protein